MDALEKLQDFIKLKGDVIPYFINSHPIVLLNHPDLVKYIFVDNDKNYIKQGMNGWQQVKPLLSKPGLSILGLKDSPAIMQSCPFKQEQDVHLLTAEFTVNYFEQLFYENRYEVIDLSLHFRRFFLLISAKLLYGFNIENYANEFIEATKTVDEYKSMNAPLPFEVINIDPSIDMKEKSINARMVHSKVSEKIIEHKLQNIKINYDFGKSNLKEMKDAITGILIAAYESLANALCWSFILLNNSPFKNKIFEEIDCVLNRKILRESDLKNLMLTNMTVQEALRIYPPAWLLARKSIKEDKIHDTKIPLNATVLISPFLLHRHINFWDNPNTFNPLRFEKEEVKKRHHGSYCPFGSGLKGCRSSLFSIKQLQTVLATLIQHYRITLLTENPRPYPIISLRPHELKGYLQKI